MKKNNLDKYIKYSNLAIQMLVIILGGVYLGKWLDEKNNANYLYTSILGAIGTLIAIYIGIRELLKNK
ncbi:MAG: AtpZ/AtpI family protein [Bacteroidales bacterium]|nr:AtpZ/AtpI family protein [Bacteroidales bacterium]MDI9575826.1 AtpZ/AtpI family protein [Bacteroidota bacterium]MDD2593138.1 AtpZ/AtpI family protein [Bacteroidales bacterium]MDD3755851.1 AtpZ/AtpI family protein [Bacteroidales bacterium]MDY0400771.1 AtpZ/AtpI family protein [Bacteroidales bacterium]